MNKTENRIEMEDQNELREIALLASLLGLEEYGCYRRVYKIAKGGRG